MGTVPVAAASANPFANLSSSTPPARRRGGVRPAADCDVQKAVTHVRDCRHIGARDSALGGRASRVCALRAGHNGRRRASGMGQNPDAANHAGSERGCRCPRYFARGCGRNRGASRRHHRRGCRARSPHWLNTLFAPNYNKIAAANDVNQIEPYLKQNLANWLSLPPGQKFDSVQAAAVATANGWIAKMQQLCSQVPGTAGQNCISQRTPGGCGFHVAQPYGWINGQFVPSGPNDPTGQRLLGLGLLRRFDFPGPERHTREFLRCSYGDHSGGDRRDCSAVCGRFCECSSFRLFSRVFRGGAWFCAAALGVWAVAS